MAEIIFLGTGAAWGVPELACDCPACFEARRVTKWYRTRSSLLLQSSVDVLIDPSTDLRFQFLRENISRIDTVVISHAHPDHFLGLDEFRTRNRTGRAFTQVPLFVGEEAWNKRISSLFAYLVEGEDASLRLDGYLYPDVKVDIGEWTLRTFPTRHGDPARIGKTFGLVLSNGEHKIVYTADYSDIINPDTHLLSDADIFITDTTWLTSPGEEQEHQTGHISFERAWSQYITTFRPQTVVLTHISHNDGRTSRQWLRTIRSITRSGQYSPRIHLAYDGFRIKL